MQVVVTGGTGKLGRTVITELQQSGYDVLSFDTSKAQQDIHVRSITGDVTDLGHVYGALAGADAVIHLAGIPTHGLVSNEETFRVNAMGAFNVHEAAWRLGIRRVVTMSSEAVLGWAPGSYQRLVLPQYLPIDENHPCGAQDCYGLSKIACETIATSYAAKSEMELIILRAPWIVSPEELHNIAQRGGMPVTNFRLYHYIDARDLAVACRLAMERPIRGCEILFVGSGETTISEPLAEVYPRLAPEIGGMAKSLIGSSAPVSVAKARDVLGWSPQYSWRTNCRSC
jgi:nucleoside-diphosphate-sugar epimerase